MGFPEIKQIYFEGATLGNPATIVAADALVMVECTESIIGQQTTERNSLNSATRQAAPAIAADRHVQVDWAFHMMEPQTPGTFSTAHHYDLLASCPVLLQDATPGAGACLMSPEMDFVMDTTPVPGSMLITYPNLEQRQIDDVVSIITNFSAEVGMPLVVSGTSHGTYAARAAHSLTGVTYTNEDTDPAKFMGSSVAINETGSGAITIGCMKSFSLDTGMRITPRKCHSATYGYTVSMVDHGGGQSRLTAVFERTAPGTTNWEAYSVSKAAIDILIPFSDGTEIQIDTCVVGNVTQTVVDGTQCDEVEFLPYGVQWWKVETN